MKMDQKKFRRRYEIDHYLKAWRDHFGMTAVELAHRAKLTDSYISHLEKGRSQMTLSTLKVLADAMGIPRCDLLDVDPENPRQNTELRLPPDLWEKVPQHRREDFDLVIRVAKQGWVMFTVKYADMIAREDNPPNQPGF